MLYSVIPHSRIYAETEYDRLYNEKEEKKEEEVRQNPIACGEIELIALAKVELVSIEKCLEEM